MELKEKFLPYYHLLYRTLNVIDRDLRDDINEDLVNLFVEDIVRLDALVSLLGYIDGAIPLLRCQKSFSTLLNDIKGLQYLYRERNMMANSYDKYFNWNMGNALDVDLEVKSNEYKKQAHEIYLNAIHIGERAIANHLEGLTNDKIVVGIMAYFKETLSIIEEQITQPDIFLLGYSLRALLVNLHFLSYIDDDKEKLKRQKYYRVASNMIQEIKLLHIQEMTIQSLNSNAESSDTESGLTAALKREYATHHGNVIGQLNNFLQSKEDILSYVSHVILQEGEQIKPDLIQESIHARNLLHSFT